VPPSLLLQPLLPWGETPARTYAPGMGRAVADRTINRRIVRRFPVVQWVRFAVPRDDGATRPHTDTTMQPAGTTSKLFGLTEGAHLPAMRECPRVVQFRNDDLMVKE
jgi:hypothetical protein